MSETSERVEDQDDDRATENPDHAGDEEPRPGEDPGPMGNPAEDEEALRHRQEDSDPGTGSGD